MQLIFSLLGLTAKLSASTSTDVIKQHDQYASSPGELLFSTMLNSTCTYATVKSSLE
jgi:hypothetical protein